MDLGVRQIRTAGKGSGSIELTLPAELRDLVGVPCRILLRDGSRPDIVLQPDLRRAQAVFAAIWDAMAAALLHDDGDAHTVPLGAFAFGLQPRTGAGERPFLCWRDGLALSAAAPHDPGAVSRTLAAFGQAMAARLHIGPALATGFGAACGHLVTGVPATPDGQEACDLAADALRLGHNSPDERRETGAAGAWAAAEACAAGVMADTFWRHAAPLLAAAADLFVAWTGDPSSHTTLRAAWCRGRAIEMSGD
ncbi:MAG: hypothetical protein ABSC06_17720 [Rhodopila sp.]|jgi:hypothetical protein